MGDQVLAVALIPMAGRGQRFISGGYEQPKPLIDVDGKPMIIRVLQNLNEAGVERFVLVALEEHRNELELALVNARFNADVSIHFIPEVSRGAAETCVLARALIPESPLIIANSDQIVTQGLGGFVTEVSHRSGSILTMRSSDPKWSYVRRENGRIVEIVEKQVVSEEATVGIYGFASSSRFFDDAQQMIHRNEKVNGEFYVAPVYNEMLRRGESVETHSVGAEGNGMWGLGIPSDLEKYLRTIRA
jgi:dTDP-glucose pyrophosphorylase